MVCLYFFFQYIHTLPPKLTGTMQQNNIITLTFLMPADYSACSATFPCYFRVLHTVNRSSRRSLGNKMPNEPRLNCQIASLMPVRYLRPRSLAYGISCPKVNHSIYNAGCVPSWLCGCVARFSCFRFY